MVVWDLPKGRALKTETLRDNDDAVLLRDGKTLVLQRTSGEPVRTYDVESDKVTGTCGDPESVMPFPVSRVAVAKEEDLLVVMGWRGIRGYDGKTRKELFKLKEGPADLSALALFPEGRLGVIGHEKGAVEVWDLSRQQKVRDLPGGRE